MQKPARAPKPKKMAAMFPPIRKQRYVPKPPQIPEMPLEVPIWDLDAESCRYPLWDGASKIDIIVIRYCGLRAEPGRSYCAGHCGVVFMAAANR